MVEHLAKRSLPRRPPAEDSFSSSDQDTSFRQRQAGMLDSEGNVLSDLKLRVHRRQGPGGSVSSEEVKVIAIRLLRLFLPPVGFTAHLFAGFSPVVSVLLLCRRFARLGVLHRDGHRSVGSSLFTSASSGL